MLIGYAWVATAGESLDLQKNALDRAGVDRLFADVATRARRPQLEQALAQLRRGDTLVVCRLDRLGRSLSHLIETVEDLSRRGIGVRSLREYLDTTTSTAKLMFHAFVAPLADFERDLIRQRTRARVAKAQARGRRRGRRPKLDETKRAQAAALHRDPGKSVDEICQALQIARSTFYRYVSGQSRRKAGRKPTANTREGLFTARGGRQVRENTRRSAADGG